VSTRVLNQGQRVLWRVYMLIVGGLIVGGGFSAHGSSHQAQQSDAVKAVIETYATMVHASYEDAYQDAQALQAALQAFVRQPSPPTLEAAKNAWKQARLPYGQTEVYRFYAGPIDDADGPEGRVNAWPLDESYVDYVRGNPNAGMINDPTIPITKEQLTALNEAGGEENISTGYHAIEFLLWGQDLDPDGPGVRPYTDYVTQANGTANHQQRRIDYLLTVADLLIADLQTLVAAWAPDQPGNYRAAFVQGNPQEALRKMLTGMGTLSRGELAGERMAVALATRDQEDEHSCFSDNTHVDIIQNALGIQNVYLGRYVRTHGAEMTGPGIAELLSPELRARMTRHLQTTMHHVRAIEPPFDREIVTPEGRQRVQEAVSALRTLADLMVDAAQELGITNLQVELPN
jgi:putative iron-regulated protein